MQSDSLIQKVELIAPAGTWDCARAAVANGADAVYFGLSKFNARMRAENFDQEGLLKLVDFLHEHDVRAFATLNTLIFTSELEEVEKMLLNLASAGVDVVIVQDLGVASLVQKMGLNLDVHASTQMTITSEEGMEFAKKLGVKRVVLARELSLREIARFQELGLSIEVFVHGALCVAYSGQCLTSESLGQRSANRGECAQACRLPYQLVVDGVLKDLGEQRYLLSPQDLMAVQEIPRLIRLGVTGFKIEGRLKTSEYVAATTRVYRKAIDQVLAGEDQIPESPEDQYDLEMVFSRGFYSGWMHGVNHQKLVHARFGKKRGAFLGRVKEVGLDFVSVEYPGKISPGDGVVFDAGANPDEEQGGRVYEIRGDKIYFGRGRLDFIKIKPGNRIWKTSDPQLQKKLRKSFEGNIPLPKKPLSFLVEGREGERLRLKGVWEGVEEDVDSGVPLQKAQKRPLTRESVWSQLNRLGESSFELVRLDFRLEEGLILPVSELNRMRREVVERLKKRGRERFKTVFFSKPGWGLKEGLKELDLKKEEASETFQWTVLCRTMGQIQTALELGFGTIMADFEDIRRYRDAVREVRQQSLSEIFLATPRIQKAGEQGFFKLIEGMEPDGVLVRNLGGLHYFRRSSMRKIGDFSLNTANPFTADLLMKEGLDRITISYDLNAVQVLDLVRAASPSWFELTLHQHIPMFHMEHCVFAAFLSNGTDHTNCGRPCDHHRLKIRDRVGVEHPIQADVGCRNTVFHAKAQSGADYWRDFLNAGIRTFRIELLDEDPVRTRQILEGYQKLKFEKNAEERDWFDQLKVVRQLGVTNGTLTVI